MVLFWSADCQHCMDLVNKLYNWWQKPINRAKLDIFAVSLDETETEVEEYYKVIPQLDGWKHILAVSARSPARNRPPRTLPYRPLEP